VARQLLTVAFDASSGAPTPGVGTVGFAFRAGSDEHLAACDARWLALQVRGVLSTAKTIGAPAKKRRKIVLQ